MSNCKFFLEKEEDIISGFKYDDRVYLSIILISYNHVDYIEDAIKSILSQKSEYRYEIIIHDDASNDGTKEKIIEYKRDFPNLITTILRDENVYSKGELFIPEIVNIAKGKYISFCEGDDYWSSNAKVNKQVSILENDNEINLTHCRCKIRKDEKYYLDSSQNRIDGYTLPELIFTQKYMTRLVSVCVRKSSLLKVHELMNPILPRPVRIYDLPVFYLLSKLGEFHFLDEELVVYRVLDESVSHSRDKRKRLGFSIYVNRVLISLYQKEKFNFREYKFLVKRMLSTTKFSLVLGDVYSFKLQMKLLFSFLFR